MAIKENKLVDMSVLDLFTLLVQLVIVIASIVLAVQGDTSALLGLGALAGGAKGSLLVDILQAVKRAGTKGAVVVLVAGALLLGGCGTFGQTWVFESQASAIAAAKPYLAGCQQITVAPALSVEWSSSTTYGGAIFIGCEAQGQLMEFRCVAVLKDDGQGKTIRCDPFATWKKMLEGVE